MGPPMTILTICRAASMQALVGCNLRRFLFRGLAHAHAAHDDLARYFRSLVPSEALYIL